MAGRTFLIRIFKFFAYSAAGVLVFGLLCFYWVEHSAKGKLYDETSLLPSCRIALVLGTSRWLAGGTENLYFSNRMNAAAELYLSGKVKKFILSGDNRAHEYNEPREMKKALMNMGIPDSCLVADYAGLRTFDSMVRCREIFGQDSVIVVSQQFHNARSVFIGERIGLTAFGYNARKVTTQRTVRMWVREFFSRIKCVLDIYVMNTRPRHLGQKIPV